MSDIDWPLDSNRIRRGVENNTFGMVRRNAAGGPRAHQGWDLYAPIGTPCHAIADGKIVAVVTGKDYGLVVVQSFRPTTGALKGQQLYAAFAHLSSAAVKVGDSVKQGQVIAKTGDSGNAKGMKGEDLHLHFEVRTIPTPGLGLAGRMSPLKIYGVVPYKTPAKRAGAA